MTTDAGTIRPVRIEEELRSSYIDYAMSVIVARALPDVRDGLKPVQRRILYAMDELAMRPNSPHKKSARLVGEVLGKYHPHGDSPVYEAMVRMAQDFSLRYPLVDGQGNFGSVDNDPPAAMRYTEARLAATAEELLADLDRDTVDFVSNFDDSLREPTVLPARLPNLLVNGATGIAVGMATSIPPHNLKEVCDAIFYLIDHPGPQGDNLDPVQLEEARAELDEELMKIVKGPDFPTRGIIMAGSDREGIREAYTTGRGRVLVRGRAEVQPLSKTGRYRIVISEIPYQVNKATLVEKIAHLARDRKIDGITDVRDESDRRGMRVVVELRGSADPEFVLSNLYEHTSLQSAFNVNMLALVEGQPQVLTLQQILRHYIDFRVRVVTRRAQFDLRRARERAHILEGLRIAISSLDEVIATIRAANDAEAARQALIETFQLTHEQAQAILDMQLRRLTALDRQRLEEEYQELQGTIGRLETLLADPQNVLAEVKRETQEHQKKFGDPRRTEILDEEARRLTREESVAHADMVVTLSRNNYIKRVLMTTYRLQHRGGKGIKGMTKTREDDVVQHMLVSDTHDTLLFFTDRGKVYPLKVYDTSTEASRTSRGTPLVNLIPTLSPGERVTSLVALPELRQDSFLVLATRLGEIKRVPLERFAAIRSNGIIAMDLEPGDELIAARPASEYAEVIVLTRGGMSVCFPVSQLRVRSRVAGGVRAIRLKSGDTVVSMDVLVTQGRLLVVSQNGFGKLTKLDAFRRQGRGGSGVIAFKINDRTGPVAAAQVVMGNEDLFIASAKAQVERASLSQVNTLGRYARGVWIMRLGEEDQITSVATLAPSSGQEPVRVAGRDSRRNGSQQGALDLTASASTEEEEPEDQEEEEDGV